MDIQHTAARAKQAAIRLAAVSTEVKNTALAEISRLLKAHTADIVAANQEDIRRAEEGTLAAPLLKRLRFGPAKIDAACAGLESLIKLDDPVGETLSALELDQGLELYKVSCPHRRHRL